MSLNSDKMMVQRGAIMGWVKAGLFILALCIAGLVGYRFGSDGATKQYIEHSMVAVPVTVKTAIKVYEDGGCPPSEDWFNLQTTQASWLHYYFHTMSLLEGGESIEDAEFYLPP